MSQKTFTITQPTQLTFGAGTIAGLADLVKEKGGSKVFLVIDPGLKAAGLLKQITAPLKKAKMPFEIYDKIDPEPGLKLADAGDVDVVAGDMLASHAKLTNVIKDIVGQGAIPVVIGGGHDATFASVKGLPAISLLSNAPAPPSSSYIRTVAADGSVFNPVESLA